MIKFENLEVMGWEAAIRGMRNPKNSWEKSDSGMTHDCEVCPWSEEDGLTCRHNAKWCSGMDEYVVGPNDHKLMMQLASGGPVHAKYRRMITVYVDITAPLYWWKEFDTYKVGTVANSCSTMHKLTAKPFTKDDFSHEHLTTHWSNMIFRDTVTRLNTLRDVYLNGGILFVQNEEAKDFEAGDKDIWYEMIQLLPSSYNQKRTVMLNYEVLAGIYPMRKNHKLNEWRGFCHWIEHLPYSELITGEEKNGD